MHDVCQQYPWRVLQVSLVYWGLTPQQQPGSYRGGDDDDDDGGGGDDDDEMSVSLAEGRECKMEFWG